MVWVFERGRSGDAFGEGGGHQGDGELARAALHGWPDRHHAEQGVEVAAGGAL